MDLEQKKFNLPELEEKILKFWEEAGIFKQTLEKTKRGKLFVFFEGPPTANGVPGFHHIEARAFKDIIPRYKTMRGFHVPREAGWDTHGLPVEIQVEKELGFKTKHDIEKYGIAKFNAHAKESVWRYKEEWEKLTKRMGFWLDMEHPYITYDPLYMETLWWIIKEFHRKGFLEEDFKVVPWCSRCGTGLSTHELGQPGAYKLIKENSVFVKFRVHGAKNEFLLVWTTTPWTLPANVAIAVNPKIEYTKFRIGNEHVWSATVPSCESGEVAEVVEKISGKKLVGMRYDPLFHTPHEYSLDIEPSFIVVAADFVSTDEGSVLVHLAPAFGEEDMAAIKSEIRNPKSETKQKINYPIFLTVHLDGTMKKGLPGAGKFVKETD